MTYEHHIDGMCDQCELKPAKHWLPFLYKDMDDKAHKDWGKGYRRYQVCDDCAKKKSNGLTQDIQA